MLFWVFVFLSGLCHSVSSECTARGRFPNDIVEDCRGYTTCIATATSFYQYDLACPPNFIFNHFDNQCTNATGYQCLPKYNCTELGTFPNTESTDCSSYIVCIQGLSGLTARLVNCPEDKIFNPIVESCLNTSLYMCPSATEKPNVSVVTTDQPSIVQEEVNDPSTRSIPANGAIRINMQYVVVISMFSLLLGICKCIT
ncbi:uncharacterized protein LOC126366556 [Pectinophora gossypiella]|uniref:uncharacterized protein LOC126366556 n=1 Tax=Pectinophora gossypiella TaxID=13191 RepID=UPI00214F4EC3|nr:uncharacterized protein LOC126366556 [Pectinophora gossypiella]